MRDSVGTILIVDDEQEVRINLFEALNSAGYSVSVAENGQMALDMLQRTPPDLVLSDVKMPGLTGLELLQQIKTSAPGIPVILVTGFAAVDSAVEAMKLGAYDYILKPCPSEVIKEVVRRALSERKNQHQEGSSTATAPSKQFDKAQGGRTHQAIGSHPLWLQVVERAKTVASSKATVLILGESGTGKEVLARCIHEESDRKKGPFIALNCAALPDTLLESELFGHEKGAFTGAVSAKKGKFELADGGTLLLDEIGEVPLHLQAKLLRVLQEEEVDRLGGKAPVKFDAHVLATTNRNLNDAVADGSFRQDLFYRLNVIPLRLPNLRERGDDVFLLAQHFIQRFSTLYKKQPKELSPAARTRMLSYQWPGNVRELENIIERAVLLSTGEHLEIADIWDEMEAPSAGTVSSRQSSHELEEICPQGEHDAPAAENSDEIAFVPLRKMERQMILQALRKTDNNRTHAAKMLGISVRTLRNKLNEYRAQGFL